ncbi:MAG: hypothetical protein Q9174_007283, partial [Haloplaca sp. 1 TL-2023]
DSKIDIKDAYKMARLRIATDPHDYIYGLHALVKDFSSTVIVDYHTPITNLYSMVTRAVFEADRSLNELKCAVSVDPDNRHDLPSWCMDWSAGYKGRQEFHFFDNAQGLFSAAKEPYTQQLLPVDDDRVLRIDAVKKGRITCVSTLTKNNNVDPLEAITKFVRGISQQHKNSDPTDIALRILTRGHLGLSESHGRSAQHVKILESWRRFIENPKSPPTGPFSETELLTVDVEMRRQRFFMTSSGLLGAGPTVMKKGDCLYLVKGSEWPLLLRPLHNTLTGNGQQDQVATYQFVGQCYVDDIMDGEAVYADTIWQTIGLC